MTEAKIFEVKETEDAKETKDVMEIEAVEKIEDMEIQVEHRRMPRSSLRLQKPSE